MVKSMQKNSFITDALKGSLISVLIGSIFILIFAAILNFICLSDTAVTVINQIIKVLSIFLGCLFGFKEKKNGLLKGLVSGLLYTLVTAVIFGLINKSFSFSWGLALDIGLGAAMGAICGILCVNLSHNS